MLNRKKETFNDGLLAIFHTDDDGKLEALPYEERRYKNRVIGAKRNYAAMTANVKINLLVRIPGTVTPFETDIVCINGKTYRIIQIQNIKDTIPVTDLTLAAYERWQHGGI